MFFHCSFTCEDHEINLVISISIYESSIEIIHYRAILGRFHHKISEVILEHFSIECFCNRKTQECERLPVEQRVSSVRVAIDKERASATLSLSGTVVKRILLATLVALFLFGASFNTYLLCA